LSLACPFHASTDVVPLDETDDYCHDCGAARDYIEHTLGFEPSPAPVAVDPATKSAARRKRRRRAKEWSETHRLVHRVAARDGWGCHYCLVALRCPCEPLDPWPPGAKWVTVDHKVPRSLGGTRQLSNVVLACKPCNKAKGSRPYEQFVASGWTGNPAEV